MNTSILSKPDQPTLNALARFSDSQDGDLILGWLAHAASVAQTASLGTENDARTRQMQGVFMALDSLIGLAKTSRTSR